MFFEAPILLCTPLPLSATDKQRTTKASNRADSEGPSLARVVSIHASVTVKSYHSIRIQINANAVQLTSWIISCFFDSKKVFHVP